MTYESIHFLHYVENVSLSVMSYICLGFFAAWVLRRLIERK